MVQADPPPQKPSSYIKLVSFYNKHFPTDRRSFNVRVPVLGLILSILALHIMQSVFFRYYDKTLLLSLAYIVVSVSITFELYWGLKVGDRKHYTPWIILKVVEILVIAIAVIVDVCSVHNFFDRDEIVKGIYVFLVILLEISILLFVLKKFYKYINNNTANDIAEDKFKDDDIYNNI